MEWVESILLLIMYMFESRHRDTPRTFKRDWGLPGNPVGKKCEHPAQNGKKLILTQKFLLSAGCDFNRPQYFPKEPHKGVV